LPVPMRKQMQHRFPSPPGLVVIVVVLGKAADVDDAELRADGGPAIGRRLTAIVETRPGKSAGEILTRGIKLPPLRGALGPGSLVEVVRADPVPDLIRDIDAASRERAGRLRSDQ